MWKNKTRLLQGILLTGLFGLAVVYAAGDKVSPWDKYDSAPESDGRLRLRALWVNYVPAQEVLSESGVRRPSEVDGSSYEYYVFIENIGKNAVELPSSPKGGGPISIGRPIGGIIVVPYIVQFERELERFKVVESPSVFRPVRLEPGETARLPIYFRIVKRGISVPEHYFYYYVDEEIARRYGWWSGALRCKGEAYSPYQK